MAKSVRWGSVNDGATVNVTYEHIEVGHNL